MELYVWAVSFLFYIFSMVSIWGFFKAKDANPGDPLDKGTEYMVGFFFWFTLALIGFTIAVTA